MRPVQLAAPIGHATLHTLSIARSIATPFTPRSKNAGIPILPLARYRRCSGRGVVLAHSLVELCRSTSHSRSRRHGRLHVACPAQLLAAPARPIEDRLAITVSIGWSDT